MKLSNSSEESSSYNDYVKAEKILISQTIDLSPADLRKFLIKFNVPIDEYRLLESKYKHLIKEYRKENPK